MTPLVAVQVCCVACRKRGKLGFRRTVLGWVCAACAYQLDAASPRNGSR
jgi:hypothetical protein